MELMELQELTLLLPLMLLEVPLILPLLLPQLLVALELALMVQPALQAFQAQVLAEQLTELPPPQPLLLEEPLMVHPQETMVPLQEHMEPHLATTELPV